MVSQTRKNLAQMNLNPKLVGVASVGWMQNTELGIQYQNYSLGVGFMLPLFEGFKTVSQIKKFELETIENEKNVNTTQFNMDETNLNFDRAIESAQVRITHLKNELQIAEECYDIAKTRYFSLQGNVVI